MADPQDRQTPTAPPLLAAPMDAQALAANPPAPIAGGGMPPAPPPNWLERHPLVQQLLQGGISGLRSYGEGIEDPRIAMHRQDVASRMAMAMAQLEALTGYREATLGERGRHNLATEDIGQQNAATRLMGTEGRLAQGQERLNQWYQKVGTGPVVVDPDSPTGFGRLQIDNQGRIVGHLGDVPPPTAMMPTVRTTETEHITRDPISGAILSTPATSTSTSRKVMPGQTETPAGGSFFKGAAAKPGAKVRGTGAGAAPAAPGAQTPGAAPGPVNKTHQVGQGAFPTTSTTRTMYEAAPKVKDFVAASKQLIDEFQKSGSDLGPVAGRWNDFMYGKVGAKDPIFGKLKTSTSLLSTLLMRMHAGARGGVLLIPHFKSMMDVSFQSPENLRASLDQIDQYSDWLIKDARAGMKGTPPWDTTGTPGAPGGMPSFSDWKAKQGKT